MTSSTGMMQHMIREHEKLGCTLSKEETVTLLRSAGFEILDPTESSPGNRQNAAE